MNKNTLRVSLIFFGLFLAFFSTQKANSAWIKNLVQETSAQGACSALDVIFLIDQSSSMSGTKPNDPTDQRAYAPQWAVDWLADNAYDICPEATHRFAMISFGTEAKITKDLCEIGPDNADEWEKVRVECKSGIEPLDMGKTNPLAAFQLAAQLFDDAPTIGLENRKRVIIFMTDGVPCLQEPNCGDYLGAAEELRTWINENLTFDETLLKQENCLKDLREKYQDKEIPPEEVNACLDQFRIDPGQINNSTYIWTMLLKQGMSTYPRSLRDIYVDIANSHAGDAIDLRKNRQDIPSNFLNILSSLAGVKATRISCGNFAVNPYLDQARLTFFKIDEATDVTISYEDALGNLQKIVDGQPQGGGFDVAEWYAQGTNERYVFNNPYPGIWRIESDACQDIDAYYEEVQFDIGGLQPLKILTPENEAIPPEASIDLVKIEKYPQAPYTDPQKPYYLQFTMRDKNGDVIKNADDPFFGVNFTVTVVDPKGDPKIYEMEWKADLSLYQSTEPVSLPHQGEYQITVGGDTLTREYPYGPLDRDLSKEKVFDIVHNLFSYEAKMNVVCPNLEIVDRCPWETRVAEDGCTFCPIREFNYSLTVPEDGSSIGPVHQTIRSGWPLKVNPFNVTVQFNSADDKPINLDEILTNPSTPLAVRVSSSTDDKTVSLVRDATNPLIYHGVVDDMDEEGNYRIVANLTSPYSEFYRSQNNTAEATFSRGDQTWNKETTYRTLFYILCMIVGVLILRYILIRTNRVKGVLVFTDGSTQIAEFPLNSGKNWIDFKKKTLEQYPQLDLKKLRVNSMSKRRQKARKVEGEDQILMSSDAASGPGVKVSGRTAETKKSFSFTLPPNQATDYSEDSVARMEYKEH